MAQRLYQGSAPTWNQVQVGDRIDVYGRCISISEDLNLPLVLGCCDKVKLQRYVHPVHPHAMAFCLCLERIARYACANNSLVMLIADGCSRSTREITKQVLDDYRTCGAPFGRSVDLSMVIDTVHFMNSHESPHIQLCDLLLYAIRRFECCGDRMDGLAAQASARVTDRRTMPY